jgi:hypothetical protein
MENRMKGKTREEGENKIRKKRVIEQEIFVP